MIQVKWIAAIVFVYIIGMILGATYDSSWSGSQAEDKLDKLSSFSQTNVNSTSGQFSFMAVPTTAPSFFSNLVNIAFLHFSFFQETPYNMIYFIFILPFIALPGVIAILYALYLAVIAILPF